MGEPHQARKDLIRQISAWQSQYKSPVAVSMNWAVQHPLKGGDEGASYSYHKWGIPSSDWAEVFKDFGEASVLYPISRISPPVFEEVQEINQIIDTLK